MAALTLAHATLRVQSSPQTPSSIARLNTSLHTLLLSAAEQDDLPRLPSPSARYQDLVGVFYRTLDNIGGKRIRLGKGKGKVKEEGRIEWALLDESIQDSLPALIHSRSEASPSSIPITITFFNPIPLTRLILRPIQPSSTQPALSTQDTIDLIFRSDPPLMFMQEDLWFPSSLPSSNLQADQAGYRVLLTLPVSQGYVAKGTTEIVILDPLTTSSEPWGQESVQSLKESSRGSNREEKEFVFDPDTFLSVGLRDDAESDSDSDDGSDGDFFRSPSSSASSSSSSKILDEESASTISQSGSLTPRASLTPTTPPVAPSDLVHRDSHHLGNEAKSRTSHLVLFEPVLLPTPPLSSSNKGKSRLIAQEEEALARTTNTTCFLTLNGLARAGVFVGDWVFVKSVSTSESRGEDEGGGRLVRVEVVDMPSDEEWDSLPDHPIFLPPLIAHHLYPMPSRFQNGSRSIQVTPIPSGQRVPSLPVAKYITLSRIATPISIDKQYEERFNSALKEWFECEGGRRLIKQGDVVAVPIQDESDIPPDDDERGSKNIAVVYFAVSYMSYEPLLPLEEDFVSSISSRARAGEFGCWIDVEKTRMMTISVQHGKSIPGMDSWFGLAEEPKVFSSLLHQRLKNYMSAHLATSTMVPFNIPLLLTGARGAGKSSLIRRIAMEHGIHVVEVDCYETLDESPGTMEGTLLARLEKAQNCAPCVLLLRHIEALGRKESSQKRGKDSPLLVKLSASMSEKIVSPGLSTMLIGTTTEPDQVSDDHMAVFKQELKLEAPNEHERLTILQESTNDTQLALDVDLGRIARETAALQAIDLCNLIDRARMASMKKLSELRDYSSSVRHLGLPLTHADFEIALDKARSSLADAIGAPKIPNVSWDDVGGLSEVKSDILDTIQLPLERPELFAEGLKKRSGILLYGPPGTGKTLLAKAVATSCSLNFFSVKGPELLNMYIGESEANVRRVFQKARDAQPCVIFMDELDSIAPKRGNQGDSGGVMDRIVSQLLAELDGMSGGKQGAGVFVMAATNRPDLLDPALLRPGRFDRMLYLSVSTDHETQYNILSALTRKFNLHPSLDLRTVSERCPFNYTGADFYALCSDAMLKAMTRTAAAVDKKIVELEKAEGPRSYPKPLTPQYYLSAMAEPHETDVLVTEEDFLAALSELTPSVSQEEMKHYDKVQQAFASETLNSKGKKKEVQVNGKGKGRARN